MSSARLKAAYRKGRNVAAPIIASRRLDLERDRTDVQRVMATRNKVTACKEPLFGLSTGVNNSAAARWLTTCQRLPTTTAAERGGKRTPSVLCQS
jgi:hypothetical protein